MWLFPRGHGDYCVAFDKGLLQNAQVSGRRFPWTAEYITQPLPLACGMRIAIRSRPVRDPESVGKFSSSRGRIWRVGKLLPLGLPRKSHTTNRASIQGPFGVGCRSDIYYAFFSE